MLQTFITWLTALLLLISPPEKRPSYLNQDPASRETIEEAKVRYESIARDLYTVVATTPEDQLPFKGKNARMTTLYLMTSIAFFESGFRKDVDFGGGKWGVGDNGHSFCFMQINIGKGKTEEGWYGKDLTSDRKKCFRAGLNLIRKSLNSCRGTNSPLSGYTLGHCENDEPKAQARWNYAFTLKGKLTPAEWPETTNELSLSRCVVAEIRVLTAHEHTWHRRPARSLNGARVSYQPSSYRRTL